MKKIVLWDIDGTLILAGGAGKKSLEMAFEDVLGVPDMWKSLNPDGRTDESIFEELHAKKFGTPLPQHIKQNLFDSYMNHLERELPLTIHFKILPYVSETLQALAQDQRYVLGLATGNFERAAYLKLKRGSLDHYFSFGGFGSDAVLRQDLTRIAYQRARQIITDAPHEVYVIGDTIYDVQCGHGIQAKTIAVCTGLTAKDQLEKQNPTYLLEDLKDVLKILKE